MFRESNKKNSSDSLCVLIKCRQMLKPEVYLYSKYYENCPSKNVKSKALNIYQYF